MEEGELGKGEIVGGRVNGRGLGKGREEVEREKEER
jgi:hypothetical protein